MAPPTEHSFWSWLARRKRAFDTIISAVTILSAIGGGIYAILQYESALADGRLKQTFQYIQRYSSGDVGAAVTSVNTFWWTDDATAFFKGTKPSNYNQRLLDLVKKQDWYKDIFIQNNFFREVAICANNQLCDPKVSCIFFFNDIQGFRETFRPELGVMNARTREDLMSDVELFVQYTCRDDFRQYCARAPHSRDCAHAGGASPT